MKKKLFLILFILITITGCGKKDGELILVTEAGFAPYEYYDNGKITGVDIEIAQYIADYLNKELVIKDVAFDSIISEVRTGKSDIGAAGISYTEERSRQVDFTINYAESKQVVIVKKDSYIKDPSYLINQKVAVQLGTTADSYLTENYPRLEIVREKKFLAAIQDLKDNKVVAVVMDELPAKQLINEDMVILNEPLLIDSYGMVVKQGNTELLEASNKVIQDLKDNGKIDEMILNHMGIKEIAKHNSLKDRIKQTLIYDNRYKYILEGLKNTAIITIGALIIGLLIGTLTSISINYHENTGKLKLLSLLSKAYVNVIRGTPSTLQLMIIYYVIFSNSNVNIVLVGILAFGINSGAYVSEIIRAGINSIDKGQQEAGYSLGLNYRQVMSNIIFPQALKNILPALGNEFTTLVKETSIGAYIGIVELTKASDIIASRTYDYFLPLILIALIYLTITMILSKLVNKMERRLNNDTRN